MKYQIIGIISFAFLLLPAASQATVIFSVDYENSSFGPVTTCSGGTCPSGFPSMGLVSSRTIVASPVRGGSGAVKVQLRATDFYNGCYIYGAWRPTTCTRAEFEKINFEAAYGLTRWYGISMYVDPSYTDTTTDPNGTVVMQLHGLPDACDIDKSPHFLIAITYNMRWRIRNQSDANPCTADIRVGRIDFDAGPVTKGVWVDWVIYAQWSYNSDGVLKVWKDGQLVVDRNGYANAYNDTEYPENIKWGSYKSWWTVQSPNTGDVLMLYFDSIKVGDENSSFDEVAPKNSQPTIPAAPSSLQIKLP